MFDLTDRVAIVTGGNGGIGLGMAGGLAHAGAHIVIVGRNAQKNAAAESQIRSFHLNMQVMSVVADITKEEACQEMVAQVEARFGRVDVLINNAGISIRKSPQDYVLADWHQVLDVNLIGAFLCAQAVYPAMKRVGGGKIINIGSMSALFGNHYSAVNGASKAALIQLTKTLACTWAADNIQVNAILPGWIETDMTRSVISEIPEAREKALARIPAGRSGVTDDLAGVAAFLASDVADYITGAAIPVDGGYSAFG